MASNYIIVLIVLVFILMNVLSQIFYKFGILKFTSVSELHIYHVSVIYILCGLFSQAISIVSWILLLKYKDLAWAGIMAALVPISIVLVGKYIFKENVDSIMMLGVFIVLIGLLLVNHTAFK